MERSLAASLRLAVIPVAFLVLAALGAFVYGGAVFVRSAIQGGRHPFPVDLKGRVIAMIVMVLAVTFVELAVQSHNGLEVLEQGGGVAVVIIALTVFLRLTSGVNGKGPARPQ